MTSAETRTAHFARLNEYRQTREYQEYARDIGVDVPGADLPSLLGQRWEIDEELYYEALEMMPPLLWRGGTFYCCEGLFADIHAKFTREGNRYWCEYARLPSRANAPAPGMRP